MHSHASLALMLVAKLYTCPVFIYYTCDIFAIHYIICQMYAGVNRSGVIIAGNFLRKKTRQIAKNCTLENVFIMYDRHVNTASIPYFLDR